MGGAMLDGDQQVIEGTGAVVEPHWVDQHHMACGGFGNHNRSLAVCCGANLIGLIVAVICIERNC
jgi:predicted amidohydrolase